LILLIFMTACTYPVLYPSERQHNFPIEAFYPATIIY